MFPHIHNSFREFAWLALKWILLVQVKYMHTTARRQKDILLVFALFHLLTSTLLEALGMGEYNWKILFRYSYWFSRIKKKSMQHGKLSNRLKFLSQDFRFTRNSRNNSYAHQLQQLSCRSKVKTILLYLFFESKSWSELDHRFVKIEVCLINKILILTMRVELIFL